MKTGTLAALAVVAYLATRDEKKGKGKSLLDAARDFLKGTKEAGNVQAGHVPLCGLRGAACLVRAATWPQGPLCDAGRALTPGRVKGGLTGPLLWCSIIGHKMQRAENLEHSPPGKTLKFKQTQTRRMLQGFRSDTSPFLASCLFKYLDTEHFILIHFGFCGFWESRAVTASSHNIYS